MLVSTTGAKISIALRLSHGGAGSWPALVERHVAGTLHDAAWRHGNGWAFGRKNSLHWELRKACSTVDSSPQSDSNQVCDGVYLNSFIVG